MPQQASDPTAEVAIPNPPVAPPAAKAAAAANRAQGAFGQRGGQRSQAIIYDSDFGRDIDTVLALAVLSNLGTKGKLAAVAVSNSSLEAATFCDSVNRFYAGESSGPFGGRGGLIVGLSEAGAKLDASSTIS